MYAVLTLLLVLSFSFSSLPSSKKTEGSHGTNTALPNATTRATEALDGLLYYFWEHDPKAKKIGFFFSCGQIGGWGGNEVWTQCSCNTRDACTDCYRWWDAVSLESIATYGIYTKSNRNATVPSTIYAHSPYNEKWNATAICTFIDDFLWYGIAYLRVYEWLKEPIWLNRSLGIYNWSWFYGWDDDRVNETSTNETSTNTSCGGVWWNNCEDHHFKDSITILQMLHFSSKLAYLFPKNDTYLLKAEKVWNWFFSFDDGYGLMTEKYLVSTGAVPENCCNSSSTDPFAKCHNSRIPGTSYNQGLLMSSSAYLYRRTGNKTYLLVGMRALEAILTNYTTDEGILIDEPRGYQNYQYDCWGSSSDPGGDWYSFQGIFMLHLGYFVETLRDNGSFSDDMLEKVTAFIQKTSDSAWTKSVVWPPFNNTSDACNTGPLKPAVNYPKFHWWWGENTTSQIIPPDPSIFFHKSQLRCAGNNTQLWEGLTNDENVCKGKCMEYSNCSKYLYSSYQDVPGIDCWIWSYNRTDHLCHKNDYDFSVGIKRPVGASCSGHCNSSTPIKTASGGVCYCDAQCDKHLDCCLDYVDQCLPEDKQIPSCKGTCNKNQALPIRGGGYCWCTMGCNPWYPYRNFKLATSLLQPVHNLARL
uniref:SMB domain-containing protein n=1 Tax=Amphimedon queenslandica TaxID=400682 RepID=A0A1X7UL71_AMPQE